MADEPAATATTLTDQPTVINGFDRLAAAATTAPAPTTAPAAAPSTTTAEPAASTTAVAPTEQQPPVTGPATAAEQPPSTAGEHDPTPYRDQPHLLPEHALLGSLLHTPKALDDLENFLGVRDFSTPHTRAVYATLRGLHRTGALFDVAAMPTPAQQLHAANENQLLLFTELRSGSPRFTTINVPDPTSVIAQLNAAAPLDSLPFRGVYDPAAQLRLGRMVLEDSCRRQLRAMGVLMHRAKPLIPPATTTPQRAERSAQTLASNLARIHNQLQNMTERLIRAVHQTGPTTTADQQHHPQPNQRRWRIPERLRVLSAPLQHRAERHILHLALHAGRMDTVPNEILTLTPNDFTNPRHANLWKTITNLQTRGLPVNYVAVFRETRNPGFPHRPMPTDRALTRMAEPPDITPERVARSLRTLVSAALARATHHGNRTISALAADNTQPLNTLLGQATQEINALATRANTAVQQHHAMNQHTHRR